MKRELCLLVVTLLLASCATAPYQVRPRQPVDHGTISNPKRYHMHVTYLHQDDRGLTKTVDELDAQILAADSGEATYYKWISYRIRKYSTGSSPDDQMENQPTSAVAWHEYAPATGFDYKMKGLAATAQGDLSNLPSMDSIPRDMDGFLFYTSVVDFHTWDIYRAQFLEPSDGSGVRLRSVGDYHVMEMPEQPIPILEWKGLSSDFTFEGGYCRAQYLADVHDGAGTLKLLSLDQNQRMKQTVYGKAGFAELRMPYEGTSRLVGCMYWTRDNQLQRASFYEYVYSKVFVPVLVPVIVHEKRIYSIERVPVEVAEGTSEGS